MHQYATWHGGRPHPRRLCVRWGSSYPQNKGTLTHPIFGPCLLRPNGWIDEDATWYGSRPRPRALCIRRVASYPRKGHSSPPLFGPCLLWPRSPISATAVVYFCSFYDINSDWSRAVQAPPQACQSPLRPHPLSADWFQWSANHRSVHAVIGSKSHLVSG